MQEANREKADEWLHKAGDVKQLLMGAGFLLGGNKIFCGDGCRTVNILKIIDLYSLNGELYLNKAVIKTKTHTRTRTK